VRCFNALAVQSGETLQKFKTGRSFFEVFEMAELTQKGPASATQSVLSHLKDFYGHGRSVAEKQSVDAEGNPIPWMTYPAIMFFEQLDLSSWRIFEYGSGNSTQYWAKRVKEIISVESDPGYFEAALKSLPPNAEVHLAQGRPYAEKSRDGGPFDMIIVDGRWRFDSSIEAIANISPNGIIVLDNSERYPVVCSSLCDAGYIQVDFAGYGPINWFTWTTSVFLSRTVSLPPARPYRPRATPGHVDAYEQRPEFFSIHNRAGGSG
jgi:hypothetical protein